MHVPLIAFGVLDDLLTGGREGGASGALRMPGGYISVGPFHQSSHCHSCFNSAGRRHDMKPLRRDSKPNVRFHC